jgi:hypothetical protein
MKIYYNDAPDVRIIIIADNNNDAVLHEIPYDGSAENNMLDYIHDSMKNGLFDNLINDTDHRDGVADDLIQEYEAVPYTVLWYAVVTNGDSDWGYGSRSKEKALEMAKECAASGLYNSVAIVTIDDGDDPVAPDEETVFNCADGQDAAQ